jgi:hypothetical protein
VDRFDSCVVLGKPPAEARAREALEAALRFVSPHLASVAGG